MMKQYVILLLLVLSAGFLSAQKTYVNPSTPLPQHPRLVMMAGDEQRIKANIATDKALQLAHKAILEESNRMLKTDPVKHIKIGVRLLDKSRECLRRVTYLSYSWRMTHNQLYLQRAEKELLAVAAFDDWNPTHYLDVAEMTMAVAIGYDWLYNDLSPTSRKIIREAIVAKGLQTSFDTVNFNHYRKWLSVINNWNQVCNAGLSFGAIAIYEDEAPLSAKVINRSIESIAIPMKGAYGEDGTFPEGYIYWGYGTTFNVLFIDAIQKVFKTDFGLTEAPGFFKTSHYLQNMIAPSGASFNYSDEGSLTSLQPAMFWFANKQKDNSLLWEERRFLTKKNIKEQVKDRIFPFLMIWSNGENLDAIKAPSSTCWMGQGENPVAAMRTSWIDPNAIYVGLKAGSPFVTHGHMDIGSFVMESEGVRWAMDFGAQEYESLESRDIKLWDNTQTGQRWEIFRYNNFTHNTLAVNGQLQMVNGYAPITGYSTDSMLMQATTDLSTIYKGSLLKASRGVAIIQKKYVVVRDELETLPEPALVRWTMLTDATVKIINNSTVQLNKNGKSLTLLVNDSSGIRMKTWPTNPPPHEYDAANPGTTLVGFEVSIPANTRRALTAMLIPGNAKSYNPMPVKPLAEWPNILSQKK